MDLGLCLGIYVLPMLLAMAQLLDVQDSVGADWTSDSPESVLLGLLRQVACGLSRLAQFPTCPGDAYHLAEALHATHRALIELEPLAQRVELDC